MAMNIRKFVKWSIILMAIAAYKQTVDVSGDRELQYLSTSQHQA